MNPPTAEAVRPPDSVVHPPEEEQRPEVIAFLQDGQNVRTPITRDCVKIVFVSARPHFDHCMVTREGEDVFLQASDETLDHLIESGVRPQEVDDIDVKIINMYANFMQKRHGEDGVPELIPAHTTEQAPSGQTLQLS